MKPVLASAASSAATDEQLVAAAREGSDEAVEALFRRYHERITAYARGIVVDPGRAEDIVQETFMSALRSLRATDQEIAFKPWIYQIAKNACIDQLRRQGRAEEISIDSDDFKPQYEGRLSQSTPTTHNAVSQREDMHRLAQAFGGLPRSQHEILVLRELEGRSYDEIARRLHLSRSAVESMLFRARRGLKDEYDEIKTGERCRRTHSLIAAVAEGMGTARDRRAISRHARLCAGCRHEAIVLGLGSLVAGRRGKLRSTIDKAAALWPFPFLRRRASGSEASSAGLGSRAQNVLSNFSSMAGPGAEQAALLPKAVAAVVATAVIAGGGIVGHNSAGGSGTALGGSTGAGLVGGPGAPGQPPSGSLTGAGTSGSPGFGGLLQGSEQSSSALSSPTALSPSFALSPSLLPLTGGGAGGGGQGGGLLGGLSAPGGDAGSVISPDSGIRLPSVGGIRLPGAQDGGGGGQTLPLLGTSPDLGSTQLPKLDTSQLPKSPSLPAPSLPKAPSVSAPSLPSTGSSVPSVPAAPTVPSTPSVPSTSSTVDTATGTVSGVTGTLNGVTGTTGPSLPQLPGL